MKVREGELREEDEWRRRRMKGGEGDEERTGERE
jgi:hypothetical protein